MTVQTDPAPTIKLLVSSTSSSKCNSFFQRDEGEHMRQRCIWKAKCIKLFDVMPVHAIAVSRHRVVDCV